MNILRECGIDPHAPKTSRRTGIYPTPDEYVVMEDELQAVTIVLYAYIITRISRSVENEHVVTSAEIRERFPWIRARGAIATIDAALATYSTDARFGVRARCDGARGGRWIVEVAP